jgi:hypothetical protein
MRRDVRSALVVAVVVAVVALAVALCPLNERDERVAEAAPVTATADAG